MPTSPTRDYFRAALEQVQRYVVDAGSRRPAFVSPHDAPAPSPRKPLPDRRHDHPKSARPALTIADAIQRMAAGSLSASGLVEKALGAIGARNSALNAFAYLVPQEELLAQARRLDSERRRGNVRGALHGIPVTIKDVIDVQGMPSTASSRVLAGNVATEDAGSVRLLKEAGAIILGKVHTHEFALGVTTPQSRNPWDPARDPGGSSGGSAIAVATGMGLASLGTDTRASIRVPAALCGVVGYKPTYDLINTRGVITLSWSLDHVAPLARTVEDIALLLDVLVPSRQDADYTRSLAKDVRGLRVGLPVHSLADADPEVLASFNGAVAALRSLDVEVVDCDLPSSDDFALANAMGLIVSRCEAAAYHSWLRSSASLYTTPVYEQLDEASRVSAVDYLQAQRFRAAIRHRMLEHLGRFDALIMPTCRVPAPRSEEADRFLLVLAQNCILWSLIGFPAMSLPSGRTPQGLPVGAQLVAAPGEDGRLLALASALEAALPSRALSW